MKNEKQYYHLRSELKAFFDSKIGDIREDLENLQTDIYDILDGFDEILKKSYGIKESKKSIE
jgi:SMC interacting uncharacterized protein involved in chromosome segregation